MSEDKTRVGEPHESGEASGPGRADHIGRYRLAQKLGEGGMGEVWQAEQEAPVRRTVALKLIKLGMDTRQVIARFESERQTLAVMNHPNIARVFDGGATGEGRPYFVMEYVPGVPIDEYCERTGPGTDERLELFLAVCDGVQHAHQKGVIHRDIKPSNILVRSEDGKAVPQIIDFGIAKATSHEGDGTLYTGLGQLVGTPAYMSPEQAAGLDVDTRTDVYALGVLLYKLLVGTTPFDLTQKGIDEIRKTIGEEEPERPSARAASATAPSLAASATDRASLGRRLRGDLDWIVLKALEKDRARRYASVSEFAADVLRHLQHQPVQAGPPSKSYRAGKFIRRHRAGVAAGALVALAVLGGATAAMVGMLRALRAEATAQLQATRANQEAETSRLIAQFLQGLFEINDPGETRGNSVTAREILDRGADQIRTGLSSEPLVQARLMDAIGGVYQKLGLFRSALPLLEQALRIREEHLGENDPEVASSLSNLGAVYYATGDHEKSLELNEKALDLREKTLGQTHPEVAGSLHNIANIHWRAGRRELARDLFQRAIDIERATLGLEAPELASSLHGLALVVAAMGDHAEARRLDENALAIQEKALGPDHPDVARTLESLAGLHKRDNDLAAARPLYERALAIRAKVLGPDHLQLTYSLIGLADLLVSQGLPEQARPALEQAIAIRERALGPDHAELALPLWMLGGIHRAVGDRTRADPLFRRSLAINRRTLAADDPDLAYDEACYLAFSGDRAGAVRSLRKALALGYTKPGWLGQDQDLASLKGYPDFEALVAGLR